MKAIKYDKLLWKERYNVKVNLKDLLSFFFFNFSTLFAIIKFSNKVLCCVFIRTLSFYSCLFLIKEKRKDLPITAIHQPFIAFLQWRKNIKGISLRAFKNTIKINLPLQIIKMLFFLCKEKREGKNEATRPALFFCGCDLWSQITFLEFLLGRIQIRKDCRWIGREKSIGAKSIAMKIN